MLKKGTNINIFLFYKFIVIILIYIYFLELNCKRLLFLPSQNYFSLLFRNCKEEGGRFNIFECKYKYDAEMNGKLRDLERTGIRVRLF